MKPIRDDVNKLLAPFKKRKGFLYGRLVLEWEAIVGKDIAAICLPYKMTFYTKKPGPLILQTKSATTLYLSSQEDDIIAKIHEYFQQEFIEKIQYKHVWDITPPLTVQAKVISLEKRQKVQTLIETVEDNAIREALQKLGLAIFC